MLVVNNWMSDFTVKVNPPGKPNVNQTTVTWVTQAITHTTITEFRYQLQWKLNKMSWSDPSVQTKVTQCKPPWEVKLDPSLLIKDETYEARLRAEACDKHLNGTWSDWSPTVAWVSQVGTKKPTPEWSVGEGALTLVVLGLLLTGIVLFIRKKKLIYVVKSFKGVPLPDPRKSEIFQDWVHLNSSSKEVCHTSKPEKSAVLTWLISHFTGEYVQSYLSSVEIVSHEVTSTVDAMMFCKPDVKFMPESGTSDSSGSSFSNPSYSELYPCMPNEYPKSFASNGPYKPVQNIEQESECLAKKDLEMVKLLFMGAHKKEAVVVSDYETVGKQEAERLRLHSVDSGMCSCEEVSKENMEADSINITEGPDEGTTNKEEKEEEGRVGNKTKLDFKTLFGGSGSILAKNSICSDYKQIPKLWSEVSMIAEENERQKDSTEKDDKPSETTCFLLPTPLLSALPQQPLNNEGSTLSSFLPPLHGNDILKQMALSGSALKQSCADGYMPVGRKRADDGP
ncbi:uncharacterized protein LOC119798254 [Cyprinodon tularosa]|uniref:uncharacterized protein LOC119798254 n=1 Tax=Cyprinodon tularosa TaxID=77115 RepID=UPI0018E1F65B|nr:uncharacterized protein LOC119798254 [Cyprinodon tularosa]